ncbi:YggS family pyridoxal phosphate-dependent enzyme [Helicobacter sp. MIT 05-5293]|uniref:Pyridoxal phosphate homeostasis protein n=1 Tax=uncultured Helicobacter sp. TaxID=175537 RepID=A0A650EMV4_9HELI|nr:YggS family pyridoxal phosphate-dependent enzyme [Helicobacter sp. MIT 05-5293]QGT50498.1 UPF0001 protein [uncultured Helicobacter sp.]TLD82087.1 YggS family pyridoxal phosphate-dependent enzyme [Helicobacter sp. MIT 05-5293]
MRFAQNLERILRRIERARLAYDAHQIISLVAVSKYQKVQDILDLYECGQRAFGENKVQDLRDKSVQCAQVPIEWHFIGKLQENKINAMLSCAPALVHSIDSLKLAEAIQKRLGEQTLRALLQVNASREESKNGVSVESAKEVYEQILKSCPNIALEGIMTIGANTEDRKLVEQSFKDTRDVFESVRAMGAKTLSMGMSGDFEIAIAYGANLVRIGTSLFE